MEDQIWYKSYAPGMPKSIDIEETTMPEFLARSAERFPGRTALQYMGKKITFAAMDRLANRFANALLEIGVKAGDKVALLMPNIPQIAIAYYGIWRMGAVHNELEFQLNDSGATAMVTLDMFAPRMLALKAKTGIKTVISAHINDYLPPIKKQLFPRVKKGMYLKYEKLPDYYQFTDLIKRASPKFTGPPPGWNDLASIFYTGGTTGVSKGVLLSHRSVSSMTQIFGAFFFDLRADEPESMLAIYPFFHVAGFTGVMNLSVMNAWSMILVPRPDPQTVMDMTVKYRPTLLGAVPTIYIGLLSLPGFKELDLSFIKGFITGAAPMAQETVRELERVTGIDTEKGTTIVECYGMTEFAIACVIPWKGKLKLGSVGVPLPNTEIKIVDIEDGLKEMPLGEEGEIVCRGPQICDGYYNRPEETENSIRDGWCYSGDIGRMDEDGYVYIVDRKKDMILAGGYNIYPREIDEVLFKHPKVLEACVIGVTDEYRGETVAAFVVTKPGEAVTEEELDAYCRQSLAAYKVPKIYKFVESLPKSAVGKIMRRELRELELQRDAENLH